MPISYLHYDLQAGYIHHWLSAGPMTAPVAGKPGDPGWKRQVLQAHTVESSGITALPVERGPLEEGTFKIGNYQGAWAYTSCLEDHLVNHSANYPAAQTLRSWAYTQLVSKAARPVTLVLTAYGKADVWLNGEHIHQQWPEGEPRQSQAFPASLRPGGNEVLVRFEAVAFGDCAHAMALQVCKPAARKKPAPFASGVGLSVRLPTTIRGVERRNFLERFFDAAYLDRDIFGPGDQIFVRWPEDWQPPDDVNLRLMGPQGWIFGEATVFIKGGEKIFLGYGHTPPRGASRILILPKPVELFQDNTRIQRELILWTPGLTMYKEDPAGTYPDRLNDVLILAARQEQGLFSEIARMELGRFKAVDAAKLSASMEVVRQRQQGCALQLMGLLGMLCRYGEHPEFPPDLKTQVEAVARGFDYSPADQESGGESQGLLLAAAAILAGQLYPQARFVEENKEGHQLQAYGARQALAWLGPRLAYGFVDWHAQDSVEEIFAALGHLVDFDQDEQIWEMASLLLDKMFLSLAVNSFKGIYGCAHHQAATPAQRSGLFEPTSGIGWLMFGCGAITPRVAGLVSLAVMKHYDLPAMIAEIANHRPAEMLHRERHAFPGTFEANLVTFKTPDTMLASAQDYRPGEPGSAEHLWQATMGPSAVVFTNHPGNASQADALAPNFWLGNALLPRIAQWKDVLVAIYTQPEGGWMGFTHAYFPTHAFDEYALRGEWAFARKGDGYLALRASAGFNLVKQGQGAFQELRTAPGPSIWVCQMGRQALDGDFTAFQEKVLALEIAFDPLAVSLETLRGERLSFGLHGALQVNGQAQPITGFKHMDDPYCQADLPCQVLEIRWNDDLLRLDMTGLSQ